MRGNFVAIFELVLLLAAAVLISAALDQVIPRLTPPLIQIALGVIIALLAPEPIDATLDPEFFLILFIAPLLYHDAKEADKIGLWRNRTAILSLAVGLVVAIMLVVGFTVHAVVPSIPLAAAFALGAALGPTDAVAVSSLSSTAKLGDHENSLLAGESLINDASGVVTFQFAIGAAVTGTFLVAEATVNFIGDFFGGIIVGIILAMIFHYIHVKTREWGLDSTTFHALFELMQPFMIYLIAELLHISGILAVVAAGLMYSRYRDRVIGPMSARYNIVSSSVWSVLAFVLNGIVFVMLGLQLPLIFQLQWGNMTIGAPILMLYVLGITALLVVTRFIWVYVMERISVRRGRSDRTLRASVKSALISTIGGPKGAVTLSIIFSTPIYLDSGAAFPNRGLIIFLASGVILCTLLMANYLLPLLAPAPASDDAEAKAELAQVKVEIMQLVISELHRVRTRDNAAATRTVIRAYHERMNRVRNEADLEFGCIDRLRLEVMREQRVRLIELIEAGEVDPDAATSAMMRFIRTQGLLHKPSYGWVFSSAFRHLPSVVKGLASHFRKVLLRALGFTVPHGNGACLWSTLEETAVDFLERLLELDEPGYPESVIREQLVGHQAAVQGLTGTMNLTQAERLEDELLERERFAYQIELEVIASFLEEGRISRNTAKELHDNVYLMLVDLESD